MKETNLTKSLNEILADMHVLNVKLHNYHWNVSGMQFHAIHKATEAYYDYFFGLFDDVAERILQLESKPLSTVKGYLGATTLAEDEGTHFDATYVLEHVVADFTTLLEKAREVTGVADEANDSGTVDLLSGLIGWLEKEIWILKATLGK